MESFPKDKTFSIVEVILVGYLMFCTEIFPIQTNSLTRAFIRILFRILLTYNTYSLDNPKPTRNNQIIYKGSLIIDSIKMKSSLALIIYPTKFNNPSMQLYSPCQWNSSGNREYKPATDKTKKISKYSFLFPTIRLQ